MIRLEDVLTNGEIRDLSAQSNRKALSDPSRSWNEHFAHDCIALAVQKWPEKVSGYARLYGNGANDIYVAGGLLPNEHHDFRHALLLLGPRYEPKPVKSAEERIAEALAIHAKVCRDCSECGRTPPVPCEMARILRGNDK